MSRFQVSVVLLIPFVVLAAGCGSDDSQYQEIPEHDVVAEPHGHDHGRGPHGGHLVELGDEEFHAEVIVDKEGKRVTVRVLGSDPERVRPIDAGENPPVLHLEIDGERRELSLEAAPTGDDPEGRSSRFTLEIGPELSEHVHDEEDLDGALDVRIDGTDYTGRIEHDHAHEEHEHEDGEGHADGEEE